MQQSGETSFRFICSDAHKKKLVNFHLAEFIEAVDIDLAHSKAYAIVLIIVDRRLHSRST